jgi:hypothetical protein
MFSISEFQMMQKKIQCVKLLSVCLTYSFFVLSGPDIGEC